MNEDLQLSFDKIEERFIERDETAKRLEEENSSLQDSIKFLQEQLEEYQESSSYNVKDNKKTKELAWECERLKQVEKLKEAEVERLKESLDKLKRKAKE